MDNFNKFLHSGEELVTIVRSKSASYNIFLTISLILLAFFMLFPMWKVGRQGFWLWIFLVFFLIYLLITQILNKESLYLITNRRIIHLKIYTKDDYKSAGSVKINQIENIKKQNNTIQIFINNKKYYLTNIEKADKVYNFIKSKIL
ncbi:hypothetical protein KKH39_03680 [Patescibacteria group bacterium]|nr:hypothetical protein [Patescibacteria group bacterium]